MPSPERVEPTQDSEESIEDSEPTFNEEHLLAHSQLLLDHLWPDVRVGFFCNGVLDTASDRRKIAVTVKYIPLEGTSDDVPTKDICEVNKLLELSHPNVIKCFGVVEPHLVVFEFMADTLYSRIRRRRGQRPITNSERVNYLYGAAKGLQYLHSKSIIHGGLMVRSYLLSESNEVKLFDLQDFHTGPEYRARRMKKVPIRWLAPETLKRVRYNYKTDVYNFSVVMYEMFTHGKCPFDDIVDNKLLRRMVIDRKVTLTVPLDSIPQEMEDLRKRCMDYGPERRSTITEVVEIIREMEGAINSE